MCTLKKGEKVTWINLNHGGEPLKCDVEIVSVGDIEQNHMGTIFYWTLVKFLNGRQSLVSSKQLIKKGIL